MFLIKSRFNVCHYGFLSGYSEDTNSFILTLNLSRKKWISSVFTDFTKAFDNIDRYILLNKLETVGIAHRLIAGFQSIVDISL